MPRPRRPPNEDRIQRLAEKIGRIGELSPTAGALFDEWIERLIAGEPLESVQPEMERVLALFKKSRRR